MFALIQNEKVTWDNCDTLTTKPNLARHMKSCSTGTLYCTQCPNFSSKAQSGLSYHIDKKHSAPKPALHLHGTQRLKGETSNVFEYSIYKLHGLSANHFQGVHLNRVPLIEDLLTIRILLFDLDFVDGNVAGEISRRSVQKYKIMFNCWDTTVTNATWTTLMQVSKIFDAPCETFFPT